MLFYTSLISAYSQSFLLYKPGSLQMCDSLVDVLVEFEE